MPYIICISYIDNYTRVTDVSSLKLEYVFTNNTFSYWSSYIIITDVTDNSIWAISINNENNIIKNNTDNDSLINTKTIIYFSRVNKLLLSFDRLKFLLVFDIDIIIDKFNNKINELVNCAFNYFFYK